MKNSFLSIVICILAIQVSWLRANDPSPEQLAAEHLKSIASAEVLSQIKSISFVGTTEINFILGMSGNLSGTAAFLSQGPQTAMIMKFQDINYPEEYYAYDGRTVTVASIKPGFKAPLAEFIYRYDKIMKNGILGGVYSNAWPLLNVKGNRATMNLRKTKVDGKELFEMEYRPRDNHGDMKIRLFFDPETYRHVRTEYKVQTKEDVTVGPGLEFDDEIGMMGGRGQGSMAGMAIGAVRGESYYTLTEKFGDFKKVGEVTLPHSYELDYMIDGSNQSGFIANWKINVLEAGFNVPSIDQNLFKANR